MIIQLQEQQQLQLHKFLKIILNLNRGYHNLPPIKIERIKHEKKFDKVSTFKLRYVPYV